MSRAPELDQLLHTVRAVVEQRVVLGRADDLPGLLSALEECGITSLGEDTADLDDALVWLSEVLAEVAGSTPSIAFALASRYAGDRALARAERTTGTGVVTAPARVGDSAIEVVVPLVQDAEDIVVLRADGVTWHRLSDALEVSRPGRTGLEQADLAVLRFAPGHDVSTDDQAFDEWAVLLAAVTVGVADGALRAAEHYAAERSQFGAPIATFTGLRALLALMHERTASARALSLYAADHRDSSADAAAALDAASRTAVDVCLDAVQVHGGYGYIDEYPIASRVRDAVSLRARARSREALATVAGSRLAVR